jgi:hypothetical protein
MVCSLQSAKRLIFHISRFTFYISPFTTPRAIAVGAALQIAVKSDFTICNQKKVVRIGSSGESVFCSDSSLRLQVSDPANNK